MYMKRNKVRLAEYHYRKALDINPHNAVILGCMGMVRSGVFVFVALVVDSHSYLLFFLSPDCHTHRPSNAVGTALRP
jgi:hypothetical protein